MNDQEQEIKIMEIKKDVEFIKLTQDEMKTMISDFIKSADKKYETKEGMAVYKKITWVISTTLITSVIGVIFYLFSRII